MSNVTQEQRDKLNELFELNMEQLLSAFGEGLTSNFLGAAPKDPNLNRLRGKNWIARNREHLANIICGSQKVESLQDNDSVDRRVELVSVVADVIAAQYVEIPVFTLAVILVKEGLHILCG